MFFEDELHDQHAKGHAANCDGNEGRSQANEEGVQEN